MKALISFLALLSIAACVAIIMNRGRSEVAQGTSRPSLPLGTSTGVVSSLNTNTTGMYPNYVRTNNSDYAIGQFYSYGDYWVNVKDVELLDPNGLALNQALYTYTTSYLIVEVVSYSLDLFYVVGESSSGDTVVEKWKKQGNIFGGSTPSAGGSGGGGTPPGSATPYMKRTELYRGGAFSEIAAVGLDPNGQFLLFVQGTPRTLEYVPLPAVVPSYTIYDELDVPHLATIESLTCIDNPSIGLLWSGIGFDSGDLTYFIDSDYDGGIDEFLTMDFDTWNLNQNVYDLTQHPWYATVP